MSIGRCGPTAVQARLKLWLACCVIMVEMGCSRVLYYDGVNTRPSYDDLLDSCREEYGKGSVLPDGSIPPISAECARTLGDIIAINWEDLGTDPGGFESARDTIEQVLSAVFLICAPDGQSAADLNSGGIPISMADELDDLRSFYQVEESDEGGALWLAYLTRWVDGVTIDADYEYFAGRNPNGSIVFSDLTQTDAEYWWVFTPFGTAGTLIHEAAHGFVHEHIECITTGADGCDADIEGAVGAEAWWDYQWVMQHVDKLDNSTLDYMEEARRRSCWKIYDANKYEWEPCAGM